MGRELQKKKRRSGRQPVKGTNKPKNPLNPRGNSIIAKNWNNKETLAQNYRRLGLVSRLKAPTGGTEKKLAHREDDEEEQQPAVSRKQLPATTPFAISSQEKSVISEARVERDASGKITRVIHAPSVNPLNDPLNAVGGAAHDDHTHQHTLGRTLTSAEEANTEVLRSLIEESAAGGERKPRHQSEREREWLARLVGRHGDDYPAMARDARLNPMQQTASDIKKRVQKMNAA